MAARTAAPTKASVAAEAWRAIFDFIVATAPERSRHLAELSLTPNDARALHSLSAETGRTMGALAQEWRCDASTATWSVDRLERRGLAARHAHPTDRRVKLVSLTDLGLKVKADVMAGNYAVPATLLELDLAELLALRDAVAKLPGRVAAAIGK